MEPDDATLEGDEPGSAPVVTCFAEYVVDETRLEAFEAFVREEIRLVSEHGGCHHGSFLPAEGPRDRALVLSSFPSVADHENYRGRFGVDPDFVAAQRLQAEAGCVLRYVRTFVRQAPDRS